MRVLGDERVVSEVNVRHKGIKSGRRGRGRGGGEMSRGVQGKLKGWGITIVGTQGGGDAGFGRNT